MAQKKFIIDGGFQTNADSVLTGNLDMTGDINMTGHILPTVDSDGVTGYDLGSPTMKWRDLYLSKGSLYIDGQKVLESDAGTIVVHADPNQSLTTKVTGTGVLTLQSETTINVAGTLQMGATQNITSADGVSVKFGDDIEMNGNEIMNLGTPSSATSAAPKSYVDTTVASEISSALAGFNQNAIQENDSNVTINDAGTGEVVFTVDGATRMEVSATGVSVNALTIDGVTAATTAYADTAEADAKAYADGIVATAEADAKAYADGIVATGDTNTLTSAKDYTDSREAVITTAYQAYADQAEADAETAAATYTDSKVATEASERQLADTGLDNRLITVEDAYVAKTSAQALHATDALRLNANVLSLHKGDNTSESVDLSLYLDDSNLARILSGTVDGNTGIATFQRDDTSTFTVDMSAFLDNTNLSRITSASWNTTNGVLTLTRNDSSTVTVDLDGRYQASGSYVTTSSPQALRATDALQVSNDTITLFKGDGTSESVSISDANTWRPVVDNLTSTSTSSSLSANQGRVLKGITDANVDMINAFMSGGVAVRKADLLATARTIALSGDVTGSASFNGGSNVTISATVANDSHSHSNYITSNANDTATGIYTFSNSTAATGANTGAVRVTGGASIGGALYVGGDVTAYSDERLKDNIETIADAGSKVAGLRGVTFTHKDSGVESTGLIAQDVKEVLPEAVSEDADGMLSVKYGNLVGLLVEAVKELQAEVKALKGE